MFRIDGPGATSQNLFTQGSAALGIPATTVTAEWLNAVQEELVALVLGAGLTLNKLDSTQVIQAVLVLISQAGSGAGAIGTNLLINGDFGIFQRATSAPSGVLSRVLAAAQTAYGFDRWQSSDDGATGAGVATLSRQTFAPGQTDVPGNPKWFARHAQTVAATVAQPFAKQKLEDVAFYSGGPMTFSVYLKASSALSVSLRIVQSFGIGGSADVVVATQAVSVGTGFGRASVSVAALPSVSGKVVNAGNHLRLEVLMPQGATFNLDLADAQCEFNPAPTPFQRRSTTIETTLCRRYFEKSWPVDVAAATCPTSLEGATIARLQGVSSGGNMTAEEMQTRFRVEKRVAPSVTWFDPSSGVAGRIRTNDVGGALFYTGTGSVAGGPTATGYLTGGGPLFPAVGTGEGHWTADAEL